MAIVGELKEVGKKELLFTKASWVADTGRFHDALKSGLTAQSSAEIEPFVDDVIVGRNAIVDATIYRHDLPTQQK